MHPQKTTQQSYLNINANLNLIQLNHNKANSNAIVPLVTQHKPIKHNLRVLANSQRIEL